MKFFGKGNDLLNIVSALGGRSFAAIARLGAKVDAAVASRPADLESVLETGPPRVGLLGPYNRPWVVTRAAAFLGLRCPARASTTWHEATCGVLGYVADPRIKKLKASGVTPLDVLTEAVCGQEDVWFLSMAMCLASSNSQKADVATQMILPRRAS
ncbi:hypothetical protein JL720_13792 [Aureococcus anophagefferens]|nr:hypothetical protein JL720_13792 [Aureococcus anophagefferens]